MKKYFKKSILKPRSLNVIVYKGMRSLADPFSDAQVQLFTAALENRDPLSIGRSYVTKSGFELVTKRAGQNRADFSLSKRPAMG